MGYHPYLDSIYAKCYSASGDMRTCMADLTAVLVPGAIVNGIECTEALWVGSSETVAAYETWPDRRPVRIINIGCVEYTQKPDWCEYHEFPLADNVKADLASVLPGVFRLLRDEPKPTLIHCRVGQSRSPAIVIAYLMKYYGFWLEQAVDYLLARRPIWPNRGFLNALADHQDELRVKA